MKKITGFSLASALLLAALTTHPQSDLPTAETSATTLCDAIANGVRRSLEQMNLQLDQQISSTETESADYKKWFTMETNGSYLFKSEQMEISFFPGKTVQAGARHNFDLNVTVKQPIYAGGRISHSASLARLKASATDEQIHLLKIDLAARIKTSYYTFRLLQWKKNSLESLIQKLSLHLKRQNDLFTESLIKKSDLLETERRIREQQLTVTDIKQAIESERIQFITLCGVDPDPLLDDNTEEIPSDWAPALQQMLNTHPYFTLNAKRREMVRIRGEVTKGGYLPQISAFAEMHYGKPGLDFFKNQWMLYLQGGVGVSFRLFDWNSKNRDLKMLGYETEKLNNESKDFLREAEKRLKQLYEQLRSLREQITISTELEAIAAEEALLKEASALEQQLSNVDYLDAQLTEVRYRYMTRELLTHSRLIEIAIQRVMGNI